jgi:LAO/AO transport system kinase
VGQDEIDIMHIAQTCLLVLTPGMGDDIQAMKAGIIEIADVIVLNKADLEGAEIALRTLEATIHYAVSKDEEAWSPPIIPTVALASRSKEIEGIDALVEAVTAHQMYIRDSRMIEEIQAKRIEQELGLIFRDEVEKIVFAGLKGTGKKREYINAIMCGRNDPYSVVQEVLRNFAHKADHGVIP